MVFSIPKSERLLGVHYACLSRTTNELLIIVGSKHIVALFVVDLKTTLYRKYKIGEYTEFADHLWFAMIQGEDRLYMIEITKEDQSPHLLKVHCKHQYVYGSNCLSVNTLPDVYVNNCESSADSDGATPPVFYEHVVQDKGRIWIFSSNKKDTSSLTEVYINEEGNLSTRDHIPPPFSSMAASFPATLSYEYLLGKKLVTKYLLKRS